MINPAQSAQFVDPVSASLVPMALPDERNNLSARNAVATYRMLAGCDPVDAVIDDNEDFDRHVFASILAAAAMDGDAVAGHAGIAAADFDALISRWFPLAHDAATAWCLQGDHADDDEVAMVRDLLLSQRSSEGETGRWLAAMIARRAIEPNHLWEDLGLRDRSELSRLLARHFGPLAARNTKNMRWKRFFYRMLCEDDGLVMCSTPVCTNCNDFDLCFGDESGESRMAERRREISLQESVFVASATLPSLRTE